MGKRKRQHDMKEEALYRPDFTKLQTTNAETKLVMRETDTQIHDDDVDLRIQNRNDSILRFNDGGAFVPASNQRRAVRRAQEFEEHLRDHALYYESMTRKETVVTAKEEDIASTLLASSEPKLKKQKLNPDTEDAQNGTQATTTDVKTQDVYHMKVRGLAKGVSEAEFRKLMGPVRFHNVHMNIGKSKLTKFVVIGKDSLVACKKMLGGKKLYGKKLQVWENKVDTSFTDTTRYVYVGNLPPSTSPGMIGAHLLTCGKIRFVNMVPNKSCCFVRFKHRTSVKKALAMNNCFFNGFYLRISEERKVDDMVLDKFDESKATLADYDSEDEED